MFAAAYNSARQEGPPSLMLVYLGPLTAYVAVVRGEETKLVKGIAVGTENLVQAVAQSLGTPVEKARAVLAQQHGSKGAESGSAPAGLPATGGTASAVASDAVAAYTRIRADLEHLGDEIQSCARYYGSLARGANVDRVIFLGPGARDPALVGALGAQLGIPCEAGDPMNVVNGPGEGGEPEPELAVAIGLSLLFAP